MRRAGASRGLPRPHQRKGCGLVPKSTVFPLLTPGLARANSGTKQGEIIAGLCLRPVAQGHWLTGLFVDPACRGQRIATQLVERAVAHTDGPVWLFCHPDLQPFYEGMGFSIDPQLPRSLVDRLARYIRTKPLIAMGIEQILCAPRI